ncbi:MAG: hypothetical protein ACI4OA_08975 [Selenomonadaceae bacterium]
MSKEKRKTKIVFMPYKAAMWDSLESVWRAAASDPDCEAYVVPIPYFERNPDFSFGERHYEIDLFPPDVPVINNEDFDLEQEKPDIIYIHNPYDQFNSATSVDPRYYSSELRLHTKLLMYVPYYATSGGMMEGQGYCNSYKNMDCIVIQAEYLRRFFSHEVPEWKIQALGSPKFDKVIRCCKNPPPIPEAWRSKMEGKKVYFYNTSIGGMLQNPEQLMGKMRYVFDMFKKHPEACLLWRPHPLLGGALKSIRQAMSDEFEKLRDEYRAEGWGIYDDTPDIEQTIALSDVYIGDSGTSVTSLFGIGGKPIFIFNNVIHSLPGAEDWRGELCNVNLNCDSWIVTANNNFYHSPNKDFHYKYYGHFSKYHSASYWGQVLEAGGKAFACPYNCTTMLELHDDGTAREIELEPFEGQSGVFAGAWAVDDRYIFLLPFHYPSLVRYDALTDEITYIKELSIGEQKISMQEFFAKPVGSQWHIGGSNVWRGHLIMTTPLSNVVMFLKADTLQVTTRLLPLKNGCVAVTVFKDELWFFPWYGNDVTRWEPLTGEMKTYDDLPEGFEIYNPVYGCEGNDRPFSSAAFLDERHVVLAPLQGNMFVLLDRETGVMEKFDIDLDCDLKHQPEYLFTGGVAAFDRQTEYGKVRLFYFRERRLYNLDFNKMEATETKIVFDPVDFKKQASGFTELSEWVRYGCEESAFNTLEDLLTDKINGDAFSRERDLAAYGEIAANIDGTSGEKIHAYAMHKLAFKG